MENKNAFTPLLTIKDAARYLALSDRTVWSLTNTGQLPAVKIGRSIRYDPRDIEAFIEGLKTK